jgi:hypothetical protein
LAASDAAPLDVDGDNFVSGTVVKLANKTAASVAVASGQKLQATFNGIAPGTYDVQVFNGDPACGVTKKDVVTIKPKPVLFFADPPVVWQPLALPLRIWASGLGDGGAKGKPVQVAVRVQGTGNNPTVLTFAYDAGKPQTLTADLPANLKAGTYEVILDDSYACQVTLADAFAVTAAVTVTLAGVDPPFGKLGTATALSLTTAGNTVKPLQNGLAVYFRSSDGKTVVPARSVGFVDAGRATLLAPKTLTLGAWDVVAVNPDGSVGVLQKGFTVTQQGPPVIDTLAPGSVPAGTVAVSILGSGFANGAKVDLRCIDGNGAVSNHTPTVNSIAAGEIKITTPSSLQAGMACIARVSHVDGTYADFSALGVLSGSENLDVFQPAATSLVEARRGLQLVSGRATPAARFLYAVGGDAGDTSSAKATVEAAEVDAFGKLGAWRILPVVASQGRTLHAAVAIGRSIYAIGGHSGTTVTSTVRRATVLDPAQAPQVTSADVEVKGGLTVGLWSYRIAARMKAGDTHNPGGLTLPSEPFLLRVPKGLELRPTLQWSAVAGADKYAVYRTKAAGLAAGKEQLIEEIAADKTEFTDDGKNAGGEGPRVLGDLSAWATVDALPEGREGLAAVAARDPGDGSTWHVFVGGGRTSSGSLPVKIARLKVTVASDGTTTEGTWTTTDMPSLATGRSELGAFRVDRTVTTRVASASDVFVYFGGGRTSGNTITDALDAAKVGIGGSLPTAFTSVTNFKGRSGYGAFAAANQAFVFGGDQGSPSKGGASGQLCGGSANCAANKVLPEIKNWNAGISLSSERRLFGMCIESGRIWAAGGQGATAVLKSVESTIW